MITVPEWYNASVIVDQNLEVGRAEKVAIHCGDEEITYGELARRINRFGHALKELRVRQEERVLLVLNDTPSFPTAFFAAIRIGAVPIPVNTLLQADEYRYFVENSRARAVVTDLEHYEKVRKGHRSSKTCWKLGRTSSRQRTPTGTTRPSGSTARARLASRRAPFTCSTT
jgi:benzoate-CoA ligase